MRDVISLLEAGNKAQLEKLKRDSHKPDFDTLTIAEIYGGMIDEVVEVDEEICSVIEGTPNYKNLRKEFADVANFCHMGILACDKIIKDGK